MKLYKSEEVRLTEQLAVQSGETYLGLMESAGTKAYELICSKTDIQNDYYVLLCGKGNNAGDAFVVARLLAKAGAAVTAILVQGEPKTEDAITNYQLLPSLNVTIIDALKDEVHSHQEIMKASVIIDGVYGIGFKGSLPISVKEIFKQVNKTNAVKFALDIPSGVDCDSATADMDTIRCHHTITFGVYKPAHFSYPSKAFCGKVTCADILIKKEIYDNVESKVKCTDHNILKQSLNKRNDNSNKGNFGKLLNICGSYGMSGAAYLATMGALRTGAGLVTLASVKDVITPLTTSLIESTFMPLEQTEQGSIAFSNLGRLLERMKNSSAVLIGCGLSQNEETVKLICELIKQSTIPLIIDADGINALSKSIDILHTAKAPIVITPHPGEMARLTGKSISEIQANRIETATQFSQKYRVVTVLKGANTVIANQNGEIYLNTTGNPSLAKGGTGDLLAGIIASFIAQGVCCFDAAVCGAFLHGASADHYIVENSEYSLIASDLLNIIPKLLKEYGV